MTAYGNMGKKSASRKRGDPVFRVDHLVKDRIGENGVGAHFNAIDNLYIGVVGGRVSR